jgi:hypothetical protein
MSEDFLFFAWFLMRPFSTKATYRRRSQKSLEGIYDARSETMEGRASVYGHTDAIAFIRLNALLSAETLQKNNVRKLGNHQRTSIASPRTSVKKIKEII